MKAQVKNLWTLTELPTLRSSSMPVSVLLRLQPSDPDRPAPSVSRAFAEDATLPTWGCRATRLLFTDFLIPTSRESSLICLGCCASPGFKDVNVYHALQQARSFVRHHTFEAQVHRAGPQRTEGQVSGPQVEPWPPSVPALDPCLPAPLTLPANL